MNWINVNDKLPSHYQQVLMGNEILGVYAGIYIDDNEPVRTSTKPKGFYTTEYGVLKSQSWVKHWMPFPIPPKEIKEKPRNNKNDDESCECENIFKCDDEITIISSKIYNLIKYVNSMFPGSDHTELCIKMGLEEVYKNQK